MCLREKLINIDILKLYIRIVYLFYLLYCLHFVYSAVIKFFFDIYIFSFYLNFKRNNNTSNKKSEVKKKKKKENMTVKLFKGVVLSTVLLFVLLLTCCTFCVIASAHNIVHPSTGTTTTLTTNTISLFKPETTEVDKKNGGSGQKEKYQSFTSPSLACVDDVLVVFAQAKNITGGEKSDVVEGYVEFKDDNLESVFTQPNGGSSWKKRVVITNENIHSEILTNVAKEKSIYVFFQNTSAIDNNNKWDYNVINGTVNSGNTKGITWNETSTNITDKLKVNGDASQAITFGATGPGIIVNKTLVVPLGYKKDNKNISTIITNTSDDGKQWELKSSTPVVEGIHSTVVEWEGKLIMMTSSRGGIRKVYESRNMGVNWMEAVGSISNVWGNTKGREANNYGGKSGFITAEIEEGGKKTKVILFTHPIAEDDNKNIKYKLHLWLTDYKRVYDVGAISGVVEQNISSTLLYARGRLFAAYEQWNNGNSTINITHLNNELQIIKKTLETWKTRDDLLSNSCFAADGTLTNGSKCTNKIPTVGLVGHLSSNYIGNNWADGYLCVNATVHKEKVTNVSGGVQFSGGGVGAVWPVGAQGQNQRYHFANYNFTLLATVRINDDAANEKGNSVLGVTLSDNKRIGLWCTNERKWGVGDSAGSAKTTTGDEKCEKGESYFVTLVLKNNISPSAYIDGQRFYVNEDISTNKTPLNITHFYFGAENDHNNDESHVTVRNVLLYNRPFSDDEINKLMLTKKKKLENVDVNTNITSDNEKRNTQVNNRTTGGGVNDTRSFDESNKTGYVENVTELLPANESALRESVLLLLTFLFVCTHALWSL